MTFPRTLVAVVGALTVAIAMAACPPQNTPQPMPPGGGDGTGYEPPGNGDGTGTGTGESPPLGTVGDPCTTGADCESGACEGEGCGDGEGTCVPADRVCTADVVEYCGCDGKTFTGSSGCAGGRYASKGACAPLADGAECLDGADCASGICEGQGCGLDNPGVCMPKARACTKDLRTYCGCDGQTFKGSGSCPGQRYSQKNACP